MKVNNIFANFVPRIYKTNNTFHQNKLERTPNKDIFFTGAKKTSNYYLEKGDIYTPRIYSILKQNVENGDGDKPVNLYDLHLNAYGKLAQCSNLDEVKELYPEFRCVCELKDMPDKERVRQPEIKSMIEGLKDEPDGSMALHLLKIWYLLEDNDLSQRMFALLSDKLNIPKLNQTYFKQINMQSLWRTPEHREKVSQYWSEEKREEKSIATKADWDLHPERKEVYREAIKRQWEDEEAKAKLSAHYSSDEYRDSLSKRLKKLWQNPEFRQKMSEQVTRRWAEDDEYRKKMTETISRKWAEDEEFRHKMSEKAVAQWQDPEYREAHANIHSPMRDLCALTNKMAWEQMTEFRENASRLANEDKYIRYILSKDLNGEELTELEKAALLGYRKRCWQFGENSPKQFGELKSQAYQILKRKMFEQ